MKAVLDIVDFKPTTLDRQFGNDLVRHAVF